MRQAAAAACTPIKIISTIVLLTTAVLLVASVLHEAFILPGIILSFISLSCYLRAPVAYDLSGKKFTVQFRLGIKEFGPVKSCSRVNGPLATGIRLWGNGGLFAGTGIHWNRRHGIFRVYLTRSEPEELVEVELLNNKKIYISPENPQGFVDRAQSLL